MPSIPQVIVAARQVRRPDELETAAPISKLRGRWAGFPGRKLMPTFHQ